ncbi:DUF2231 domain-containing protein [Oceanicella sp. SM1341]|uniref:DUF2231 domain-containing protein n=1 Tax=Oceanicella sp. SM1341 TaxID=1548889 RepID=UPI000E4A6310|nr:DUF2231 domain-containing protein [Oceanicella sp. SM1341]
MVTTRPLPSRTLLPDQGTWTRLTPFPAVCFTLALCTDIAYWQTSNLMWQNFSSWLLFAGLVVGGIAALVGLIELLARRGLRGDAHAWMHWAGIVVALLLALLNSLIHAGDGWSAVVPGGLVVSALTVVVLVFTAWLARPPRRYTDTGARIDD